MKKPLVSGLARVLGFASLLIVSACSVGPEYHRPSPAQVAPEQFVAQHGAAAPPPDAAWWHVFHDPAIDALVPLAQQRSADLAVADANIRQARAALGVIDSARALQVDLNTRLGRDQFSRDSENFANLPFPNPKTAFTDYRGGLDVSWEIDLFGVTAHRFESGSATLDAQTAHRRDVALSVMAETVRTVLDHRHLALRLANLREVVRSDEALLRLVDLQRRAGLAGEAEHTQAKRALREAAALVPPIEAARDATVVALIPLTGLSRDDLDARLGNADSLPSLPGAPLFAVDSAVLERRPDVAMAERRLAAATADLGVAVADRYPRFTLIGDAGWDSVQPGQFGQRASRFWNIGPQITLPMLNGGRVSAQIRASSAAKDAADSDYRRTVLAALAETESTMLRCGGDERRLQILDDALALQAREVSLIQQRIDAGEASNADKLSAMVVRGGLLDQRLIARQTLADDLVLLIKSLGGG